MTVLIIKLTVEGVSSSTARGKVSRTRPRICVDCPYHIPNPRPEGQIRKNLHNGALISKGWLLEYGHILHHPVLHHITDDLIDKIDLPLIQIHIIEIPSKRLLGGVHI